MVRTRTYDFEGNVASMFLEEGVWTDDSAYKKGGSFAAELKKGDVVKLSADWRVIKSDAANNAIGELVSEPVGPNTENKRVGTIKLYCDTVSEVTMVTTSYGIALGGSVEYSGAGNLWTSASANETYALVLAASSSGAIIPVMRGKWDF